MKIKKFIVKSNIIVIIDDVAGADSRIIKVFDGN